MLRFPFTIDGYALTARTVTLRAVSAEDAIALARNANEEVLPLLRTAVTLLRGTLDLFSMALDCIEDPQSCPLSRDELVRQGRGAIVTARAALGGAS
jgi:hypothetical protein